MTVKVRYTGKGEFLPGVPASDHEVENDAQAKELAKSGLYEVVKPAGLRKEGDA